MSNLLKKIERKKEVEEKKDTEKKMAKQLNMFDRIPDKCDVCSEPFDRKSKEMAQTWTVVVRSEQNLVRLFCPSCIDRVKEVIENENTKN